MITLGHLASSVVYLNKPNILSVQIVGGVAPFSVSAISGSLPNGMTVSAAIISGVNYVYFSGIPTEFGTSQVTIGGLDSNSDTITAKTFTIVVKGAFSGAANISSSSNDTIIPVSGLPTTYGDGVVLEKIIVDRFSDATEASLILDNPNVDGEVYLYGANPTGDIIDAQIYKDDAPYPLAFTVGTSPWTGKWKSYATFLNFDGFDTNGDWKLNGLTGDITVTLIFAPI